MQFNVEHGRPQAMARGHLPPLEKLKFWRRTRGCRKCPPHLGLGSQS